ncbi:MAG: HPr family phosphocarrier protein [Christensenellales bacterium]
MVTLLTRKITLGGELPFTTQRLQCLANAASAFQVRVLIKRGNNTYNAKSLLGLLAMAREREREITLLVDGEEEQQAMEVLCTLLSGKALDSQA